MKRSMFAVIAAGSLALAGSALAARPARNISWKRHRNLAAAQALVAKAYAKIEAAQKANEFDLNGHAKKAEQLLNEASQELKAAATTANVKDAK